MILAIFVENISWVTFLNHRHPMKSKCPLFNFGSSLIEFNIKNDVQIIEGDRQIFALLKFNKNYRQLNVLSDDLNFKQR